MSHILYESNAVKKDISHLGGGKSQGTMNCVIVKEGEKVVADGLHVIERSRPGQSSELNDLENLNLRSILNAK